MCVPLREINKKVNTGKVLISEFQMFHSWMYDLTEVLNESNFLHDFEVKNIHESFFLDTALHEEDVTLQQPSSGDFIKH